MNGTSDETQQESMRCQQNPKAHFPPYIVVLKSSSNGNGDGGGSGWGRQRVGG